MIPEGSLPQSRIAPEVEGNQTGCRREVVIPVSAGIAQHRRNISLEFSLKCGIIAVE